MTPHMGEPPPRCPVCPHAGHFGRCRWVAKAPAPVDWCRCEVTPPTDEIPVDRLQGRLFADVCNFGNTLAPPPS
jgi:hypothetical protein